MFWVHLLRGKYTVIGRKYYVVGLSCERGIMLETNPVTSGPPPGPNSFILMQFSAKNLQNNRLPQAHWEIVPAISGKSWICHMQDTGIYLTKCAT